jgi:hypothetical protein
MTATTLFAAFLLAATGNIVNVSSNMLRPFDYKEAAQHATTGTHIDKRPELRACVENWRGYEPTRVNVFQRLEAAGFHDHSHSLLLEVGGSGFGYYGYVAVIEGEQVDFGDTGDAQVAPKHTKRLQQLTATLNDDLIVRMKGEASSGVIDGTCYFLTATLRDSSAAQAAVYGPPLPRTFVGKTIRTLLPYLRRVNFAPRSERK